MSRQINCNLLEADVEYIAHQCNATGNRSLGLASSIFKMYPNANIYSGKHKVENRENGSIIVRPVKDKKIINMICQLNPGKPSKNDSKEDRLGWLTKCLTEIIKYNPSSVAFPYHMGCGLAGGDWENVLKIIDDFANCYPEIDVIICKI